MGEIYPRCLGAAVLLLSVCLFGPGSGRAEQLPAEAVPCLSCHSQKNMREMPEVPSILGQDAKYLIHQIVAFQRGFASNASGFTRLERKHPMMSEEGPKLEQADVKEVAEYFAGQACVSAWQLEGGATQPLPQPALATRCFLCHGQEGRSHHAYIPTLAGQRREYLQRQLLSFRNTTWIDRTRPGPARSHNMMTRQGQRLNDAEIQEMAAYFSSLSCR